MRKIVKLKKYYVLGLILLTLMYLGLSSFQVLAVNGSNESIYLNKQEDVTKHPIKQEIKDLREQNSKVFLKVDGLFEKSTYLDDIHYLNNGKWEDIDNRLVLDSTSNEYENIANKYKIKLPKELKESKKLKLDYLDYSIDWIIDGIETSEISILEKQNLKSDDLRELMNINQSVVYENILNDVNLEYVLFGKGIKENIILNSYQENFRLSFTYNLKGLELVEDNGELIFVNSNQEEVFKFDKLYMIDNQGDVSTDVNYEITKIKDGEYQITIIPNDSWLNNSNRSYPVKIDPTITFNDSTTIKDKFVITGQSGYYDGSSLTLGNDGTNVHRSYMEFNLGQMIPTSTIVNATLTLDYAYNNCSSACKFYVKGVENTYSTINGNSSLTYTESNRIYDYDYVNEVYKDKYDLNLTNLFQNWLYQGKQYGTIELRAQNEVDTGKIQFYSMNYGGTAAPIAKVTYVNQKGLESYWSYHEQSNGAGTGYVNDYSGNLTFIHSDIVNASEKMGFSISHIYNSFDKDNNIGYGNGWRINYHAQAKYDSSTDSYYIIDGDGSERYFDTSKTCSELGITTSSTCGLAMDGSGDTYSIENNKLILRTRSQIDYTFSLSYSGSLTTIYENKKSEYIRIYYTQINNQYVINYIWDTMENEADFVYANNKLDKINFYKKDDMGMNQLVKYVKYAYTDNDLTSIKHYYDYKQDGAFSNESENILVYNNGLLERAKNTLSNELKYDYTNNKVTKIQELYNTNILGSVSINYQFKKTTYTDYKDNSVQYIFDNYGRTVNILDSNGNALFYKYIDNYSSQPVNYYESNKIESASKPQKSSINSIYNHGFEFNESLTDGTNWFSELNGNGTAQIILGGVHGNKKLELASSSGEVKVKQQVTLQPGSYSITGWIRLDNSNNNQQGGYITILQSDGITSYPNLSINKVTASSWQKYNLNFTIPEDSGDTVVYIALVNDDVGSTASFDQIQLIDGFVDNRYNLVYNQSFESDLTSWTGTTYTLEPNTEVSLYDDVLGDKVVKVSNAKVEKVLSQTIDVNSNEIKQFVFGGWGKSYIISGKEYLRIKVTVNYSDGTFEPEFILDFNDQIDQWQYISREIVLDYSGKSIDNIRVDLIYKGENVAYFDGIQIYVDSYGTQYEYSDDGKVEKVTDPNNKSTIYEYNGYDVSAIKPENSKQTDISYNSDKLISSIEKNSKITFTYDYNGNVKATKIGDTRVYYTTEYEYRRVCDEYGGCTFEKVAVTVTNYEHDYFENKVTYTDFGQYINTTTDEFNNTTDYDYDIVSGLLNQIKNAKNQVTSFIYDDYGRLKSVSSDGSSNSYSYLNGKLDLITVNGFSYKFNYDDKNRLENVQVADTTLLSYYYKEYNTTDGIIYSSLLEKQIYANGDKIRFDYDDEDRVTEIYYDSDGVIATEPRYSYEYDSNNLLAQSYDALTSTTFYYNYDTNGRIVDVRDSNGNKVSYGYHELHGDLNEFSTDINGLSRETNYYIDYTNGVYDKTQFEVDGVTATKQFDYDFHLLQRLSGFTVTFGTSTNQIHKTEYFYDDDVLDENGNITDNRVYHGSSTYRIRSVKLETTTDNVYKSIRYSYDSLGNITSVEENDSSGALIYSYTYEFDSLNQLVRENISNKGTYVYEYDLYGNIKSKKEYDYAKPDITPSNLLKTTTYVYNTTDWKDQLKEIWVDGVKTHDITFDDLGNPLSYKGFTFSWEGRQLVDAVKDSKTFEFTYNDGGYRTQKIVDGVTTEYYLVGDKVVYETNGTYGLYFTYDSDGTLISMNYDGNVNDGYTGLEYFYIRNLQNDIIALADENGTIFVQYQYDAWGNIISTTDNTGVDLAKLNPYRYRGYRYDEDLGLYYLNSRYYDSSIGRFINADGLIGRTGEILSHNMYAYCQNNPVLMVDPSGYSGNVQSRNPNKELGIAIGLAFCIALNNPAVRDEVVESTGSLLDDAFDAIGDAIGGIIYGAKSIFSNVSISASQTKSRDYAAEHALSLDQTYVKENRILVVAALVTHDGQVFYGYNSEGVINGNVQNLLLAMDRIGLVNIYGGQCAEVNAISKALNAGADIRNAQMFVVKAGGPNRTGVPYTPCATCQYILNMYNITYMSIGA